MILTFEGIGEEARTGLLSQTGAKTDWSPPRELPYCDDNALGVSQLATLLQERLRPVEDCYRIGDQPKRSRMPQHVEGSMLRPATPRMVVESQEQFIGMDSEAEAVTVWVVHYIRSAVTNEIIATYTIKWVIHDETTSFQQ